MQSAICKECDHTDSCTRSPSARRVIDSAPGEIIKPKNLLSMLPIPQGEFNALLEISKRVERETLI